MTGHHVLLTGATGQVGRYLLRDLMARGQSVAVLIRRHDRTNARERLVSVLRDWNDVSGRSMPVPVCLEGDTSEEGYGLGRDDRAWISRHCRTILHCAGRVEFTGQGVGATWDTNVSSAHHTVGLCHETKIEQLAYVSTAYVCGRRAGIVREDDLDMGQSFRNEYERSKFEAETVLRRSLDPGMLTVVRPAIIVGDSETGRTNSFHGFYRYVQFTSALANAAPRDAAGRWSHAVRLTTSGHHRLNLVAIDWTSSAIVEIVLNARNHGKTYHLTPRRPTTLDQVEEALQRYFQYEGVRFTGPMDRLNDATTEERRFYEYVGEYIDYWREDPLFDRANTDAAVRLISEPRVDVACLLRLIEYAVKARFGRRAKRPTAETKA